ncbi:MAG: Ig-like domain-containing protein [Oscillospiraceae bacterium]
MSNATAIFYNSPNVKIKCISGSEAETYAKNNSIQYSYITAIPATSIKLNASTYTVARGVLALHPIAVPANTTDVIRWISGNTDIATIDSTGLVSTHSTGTVQIKATTTSGKTAICTIEVVSSGTTSVDKENVKNITLGYIESISDQTVTGLAIKPTVNVMFNSCTKLIPDVDYTVAYTNNTGIGTATVTITGKGNYTGTLTKTFKIAAKSITGMTATLSATSYTYTGTARKPAVTVKSGSTTLKNGTDYTVTYKSNTAVGKATVTIKGIGKYTDTITKTFKINPKSTAVTLTAGTKKATVKFTKVPGATGYEIYRATSKSGTYTKVKTTTATSFTNTGLTKGKTYYYKVRTYKTANGAKFYSAYSPVKSVKVK